jgi:hypothetical protein
LHLRADSFHSHSNAAHLDPACPGSQTFIISLTEGWVLLTFLISNGRGNPSHCEVYYARDGKLFCNGAEISAQAFVQKLYCDEKNQFIIGRKKGGED